MTTPAVAPPAESDVRALLLEEYGVVNGGLRLLAGGLDRRAWTYRVDPDAGAPLVVRATGAEPPEATHLVPRQLRDSGIEAVVAPVYSRDGSLVVRRDALSWSVFPFVDGTDGWGGRMTGGHWRRLGAAMSGVHRAVIPPEAQHIRRQGFDVRAHDAATRRTDALLAEPTDDPAIRDCAQVWAEHRPTILAVVEQLTVLAADLTERPRPEVICHGDLHPGNVLLAADQLHIIDWDEVRLAPRERDLLFVPDLPRTSPSTAGPGPDPLGLGTAFFEGYGLGEAGIDWVALTYFRCERVIEDLNAFADDAIGRAHPPDVRSAAAGWLRHVLQPDGELDTAAAAAGCLPPRLDCLADIRDRRRETARIEP